MSETGLDSSFFFFLFCWRFIVVWSNLNSESRSCRSCTQSERRAEGAGWRCVMGGGMAWLGLTLCPLLPPFQARSPAAAVLHFDRALGNPALRTGFYVVLIYFRGFPQVSTQIPQVRFVSSSFFLSFFPLLLPNSRPIRAAERHALLT